MAAGAWKGAPSSLSPDGPVPGGGNTMSASVMTIQRSTWNGARVALAALVIAVAVLVSLLIITNNDSSSASTPTRSVRSDIACGVGHPC